ncbi:hypothetical protein VTK26DRAFT_3708 [Humicola hyalothermophila]
MAHDSLVVLVSSSPELPSICDLLPRKPSRPPLRSGSNATPIPENAPQAFSSATSVLQSSRRGDKFQIGAYALELGRTEGSKELGGTTSGENTISEAEAEGTPGPEVAAGKVRKPAQSRTRKKIAEEPGPQNCVADVAPTKKPSRKPKASKDSTVKQTTLPKGKITKPASKEGQSRNKPEIVSRHFAAQPVSPVLAPDPILDPIEDEDSVPEPAMTRRLDWTPPRTTALIQLSTGSPATKEFPSSDAESGEHGCVSRSDVFKNLSDAYGCKDDAALRSGAAGSTALIQDVLGKRKLVELVATSNNKQGTPEASPTKPKAPKKRPRTITELATAAYRLPEQNEFDAGTDGSEQNSILCVLEPANEKCEPRAAASKVSEGKGKAPKRPSKPKPPKKKKEEAPKPVLLSPKTALRQVSNQDFVFGTASQLATEDDPELLRALHEAMKISNQADSDPFASPDPVNTNLTIRARRGGRLWDAGARDDEGELLDLEILDLTRSSPLPLNPILPNNPGPEDHNTERQSQTRSDCIELLSDTTLDLADSPKLPGQQHPSDPPQSGAGRIRTEIQDSVLENGSAAEDEFELPPSNQEQHQLLQSQSISPLRTSAKGPEAPPRPNFELYTDARLAKEVASYGFKPVKKRAAMIALLEQCWASQNKGALATGAPQASMSTSTTRQITSSARPGARSSKDSAASASDTRQPLLAGRQGRANFPPATGSEATAPQAEKQRHERPKDATASSIKPRAPASTQRARSPPKPVAPEPTTRTRPKAPPNSVVEIADSESEDPFTLSPCSSPNMDDDNILSSPPTIDLSTTEDTEESSLLIPNPADDEQVAVFKAITQAVLAAPRSTDPAKPSWHERMLMYDPVVLEDFAAWLNSSGRLDRFGVDREVSAGEVKRWCQSKSVCCLWRVSLRGRQRKRF